MEWVVGRRRRGFSSNRVCGAEADDQQAVFLVGRRGEDLRHPFRQERVGGGHAFERARRALAGGARITRGRGDVGGGRGSLCFAQVGGQLLDRDVVGRTVAEIEQRVEVDARVLRRRVGAKRRGIRGTVVV